jgi:uncharacterized protein (DUF2147 family)
MMMMWNLKTVVVAAALIAVPSVAFADPSGVWLRETGESRVQIAPCGGGAYCGKVVWLKDPKNSKSKVGQQVFFGMKPNGANQWSGSAFNPDDGKTYSGTMQLSGSRLTTAGCVLGGLICRSVNWSKVN